MDDLEQRMQIARALLARGMEPFDLGAGPALLAALRHTASTRSSCYSLPASRAPRR